MLTTINRTVLTDNIFIHEVNVVSSLKKQVDLYCAIAIQSPKTLPVVKLGRVSNKLFVLYNFDVYFGIKQSGLNEIECEIVDFPSNVEFIIEHVKLNKNTVGFNPLLLYCVLDYLQNHDLSKEQVLGLLQIHNTSNHKLLNLSLQPKVVEILCALHNQLAEKLTNFSIPYFIPEFISKYDLPAQIAVANTIKSHMTTGNFSDSKFVWPKIGEIKILMKSPKYIKSNKSSSVIVPEGETPLQKDVDSAEDMIRTMPDTVAIPRTDTHVSFVVNTKNHGVTIVDDIDEAVTCLKPTPSNPLFSFPKKAVTQLDLEEESLDVKMKCFSNSSSIIKYLQKHPETKGVLFYR